MNKTFSFLALMAMSTVVLAYGAFAQAAPKPPKTTLIVNGHAAPGNVLQVDGRSYVDVLGLAQTANASVSFEPGKILLTLPNAATETHAAPEHAAGLSREFAEAGIATISDMREWRGAVSSTIRFGVAAGNWLGPFLNDYQTRSQKSLNQALLAAKTDSDHKASELLKNEFANLRQWDSQTQANIQSLNAEPAVNPAASENDPLRIKIADCSRHLDSMLVSGEFADDLNCH